MRSRSKQRMSPLCTSVEDSRTAHRWLLQSPRVGEGVYDTVSVLDTYSSGGVRRHGLRRVNGASPLCTPHQGTPDPVLGAAMLGPSSLCHLWGSIFIAREVRTPAVWLRTLFEHPRERSIHPFVKQNEADDLRAEPAASGGSRRSSGSALRRDRGDSHRFRR